LNESFFNMLTFDGAAAFGFNHPLVLAVLAINAINIPVHHISRELETGTLELLLAHPFKRQSLIISLWFSGCIILCAIIVAALIGSFSAIALFHQLSMGILLKMFQISFNLWMLFVLIFTYTLLIASFGKTGSKAGNISAVVTFVFYMLHFLSQLWSSIEFTKPFNIFTYYEPQNLMFKQDNIILNSVVLGSLILICLLLSLWQFNRRDIP
ncbi:MAG: ABC transporter permease subunit, partial [Bacteroidales bacterium]|nr:ABC transporter permease subunit [Bacteroidales bacterium]